MYNYEQIKVERRGRLLVLTLDNPPMNTMSRTLHREMASVFYDVQADRECDVAIVTGSGNTFSAGGDIPLMQSRIDDPELMTPKNAEMKRIISSLLELEKPLICRMNGDAVGFGATLALFCDITIAVDTARIGDPHVRMGYVTGDGSALIWPQLVGFARAKEYLLTGDMLDAKRAVEIGLINYAVPADELDDKVDYFANKLVNGAAKAIRWSKTCINIPLRQAAPAIIDAAIAYQTITNVSNDHQEAVNAFREKRKPRFTGS
jgi:enoyl-CoA hydratase